MDISKISYADRSEVLVQALPHIQKYHGKTVVIKYGGNAMINEALQDAVMTDKIIGPKSLNCFGAPYVWAVFKALGVV